MAIEFLSLADCSLAYQRQVGRKQMPGVLFLSGYASDMEGTKATFLSERCFEENISFIRFDYRGCGKSPGEFLQGTIGAWLEDAKAIFDRLTEGPQIIVGASMGGWLALLLAQARSSRVKTIIGVAAAPDFTEELIFKKLTKDQHDKLQKNGIVYEDAPDNPLPMTLKMIEEARAHLLLKQPFPLSCPLRLLQGMKDQDVPSSYAAFIAERAQQEDVSVTLIKNGDHRLNRPEDLELLWQTIAVFLQ